MKPIYKPAGAAAEYGEYAVNIYTGCPHRCYYCFAPQVLRRDREQFHTCVEPRKDIVAETARQLEREGITGKLVHLCFTCDPYPMEHDTWTTREVIKLLKEAGNHVQILTKGSETRDFDLLDGGDWYGVTISSDGDIAQTAEPWAASVERRLTNLELAKQSGIRTWVSFEPVLDQDAVVNCIMGCAGFIDRVKIGKLNYWPADINWAEFGRRAVAACREMDLDFYIKDGLRKEMEKV